MAMTKKEREEMESLRRELRIARAMRFTDDVLPDVPVPSRSTDELSKGYLFNAHTEVRVEPACSSSMFHAFGRNDRTTTQGPAKLFSTQLLALRAGRRELELKCATMLAEVDEQIELEQRNSESP